jgi:hypothetical protein
MVVDWPAPLGPTKPVTWPGWTVNVIPSRATVGPNRLRRPLTSMVASMLATVGKYRPAGRHAGEPSLPPLARGTPAAAIPRAGDGRMLVARDG